jgi:hypothetical protein
MLIFGGQIGNESSQFLKDLWIFNWKDTLKAVFNIYMNARKEYIAMTNQFTLEHNMLWFMFLRSKLLWYTGETVWVSH